MCTVVVGVVVVVVVVMDVVVVCGLWFGDLCVLCVVCCSVFAARSVVCVVRCSKFVVWCWWNVGYRVLCGVVLFVAVGHRLLVVVY